jgi:hypothetical protein
MISFWPSERSKYHENCVRKVFRYLKKKCDEADYERSLVPGHITDAYGHDTKSKTWYICEIKVNWGDLQKAPHQIYETAFLFKKKHRGDTVIPVIALPSRLQKELVKYNNWVSLCSHCKATGVAIWAIESASVRQIKSSGKTVKAKNKKITTTAKKKTIRTKNTKSKSPAKQTKPKNTRIRRPKT